MCWATCWNESYISRCFQSVGVTRHAAKALQLTEIGTITSGAPADLVVWACDDPAAVPYRYGSAARLIEAVYAGGTPLVR